MTHAALESGESQADDYEPAVQLMTMHSAKGLEFPLVFIAGFGFMYWGQPEVGGTQHSSAMLACIVGFIWYVINRVRILLSKRSSFKF